MPRRSKRNTKPTAKAGDCAQPNPKKTRRGSKKKATKAPAPASQTFAAVPNLTLPPPEELTQVAFMPPVDYPSFGDSGYPTDSMFATPAPHVAARFVGLPRPPTPRPSPAPQRQVMRTYKVTQKNVSTKCSWNAAANLQLANHMQVT
jgi:hypothetical protein